MSPTDLRSHAAGARRRLTAPFNRASAALRTRSWQPYSRLFVPDDGAGWVIGEEARHLGDMARELGIALGDPRMAPHVERQSIFHLSRWALLTHEWPQTSNRLGFSYFHGRPGEGSEAFDACYDRLRRRHAEISRVQVSNQAMRGIVLECGIDPAKVFLIPIAVDLPRFPLRGADDVAQARRRFDIPASAFVLGSFQKDGVGWGEGLEPKLIKGPDVLLATVELLKEHVPELFVFLTGPSRGFVRRGLERLGVPYRHVEFGHADDVARAYPALDAYAVTSRDEGGPKAVLECMAVGVPLVSTRVGQATDLIEHGRNGWLVDVEDVDGMVEGCVAIGSATTDDLSAVARNGRETAEQNSYAALVPRWTELLEGFVSW